jgi:hypothetical protein
VLDIFVQSRRDAKATKSCVRQRRRRSHSSLSDRHGVLLQRYDRGVVTERRFPDSSREPNKEWEIIGRPQLKQC